MARIRQVKPEFFTSEKVSKLTPAARLLFIGMLTQATDNGTLRDDPLLLRLAVFPRDTSVTDEDVSSWVSQMIDLGMVRRVEAVEYGLRRDKDKKQKQIGIVTVWEIVGFNDHQSIQHKSLLRYVPVDAVMSTPVNDDSMRNTATLNEPSHTTSNGDVVVVVDVDEDEKEQASAVAERGEETVGQIANRITKDWYEHQNGAVNFNAVRQVVTKMLKAGWPEIVIKQAMVSVDEAGAPMTADVLRQQLQGKRGGQRMTADQRRMKHSVDLIQKFANEEALEIER